MLANLLSVWVCGREESVKAGTHAAREGGGNSGQIPSEPAGRKDHVLSLNLTAELRDASYDASHVL